MWPVACRIPFPSRMEVTATDVPTPSSATMPNRPPTFRPSTEALSSTDRNRGSRSARVGAT